VRTPLSRRASVLLFLALLGSAAVPAAAQAKLGDRAPLRSGMSGQDIRVLQDYLTKAGYDTGVDGQFGKGTKASVKAFEVAASLPADGVMTAADIAALRQAVDGGAATLRAAAAPPTGEATIGPDGKAIAPADAPLQVQQIIAAGNAIAGMPYKYGGGHGDWNDSGYDCSGSVSYALHGAGLLNTQLTSGDFARWGDSGAGQWVTIYANSGHVYMIVAGLRFDTSGASSAGSRWQKSTRSTSGYTVRHPTGL
jgi:peptidoglycan hydrolase-like protein with peptidoglycan-binding domain